MSQLNVAMAKCAGYEVSEQIICDKQKHNRCQAKANRPAHRLNRKQDDASRGPAIIQRQRIEKCYAFRDDIRVPQEVASNNQRDATEKPVRASGLCFRRASRGDIEEAKRQHGAVEADYDRENIQPRQRCRIQHPN